MNSEAAAQREPGQDPREDHGRGLGGDYEALTIDAVGGDSSEGSEEKDGDLAGKADGSQQQRGSRKTVDEPCLGYALHPGAG